jgi:hypothetical protein
MGHTFPKRGRAAALRELELASDTHRRAFLAWRQAILTAHDRGASVRDIARYGGLSKSRAHRMLRWHDARRDLQAVIDQLAGEDHAPPTS